MKIFIPVLFAVLGIVWGVMGDYVVAFLNYILAVLWLILFELEKLNEKT